jgi:hypothetical protein
MDEFLLEIFIFGGRTDRRTSKRMEESDGIRLDHERRHQMGVL